MIDLNTIIRLDKEMVQKSSTELMYIKLIVKIVWRPIYLSEIKRAFIMRIDKQQNINKKSVVSQHRNE